MKMDNHQTFEENLARLEKIISQLEEGDVHWQILWLCSKRGTARSPLFPAIGGAEARIAILTSKRKGECRLTLLRLADE